jgi:GT2 family glycosyltransferase
MDDVSAPLATVVVAPRDAYEHNLRCFDRLLECTPAPRRIVYVDGGSPEPLASELAARAAAADVALLRTERVLTGNEGRNLGLELARAGDEPPWVAFVDNDALVEPGWLEGLCACGEATGAAAVMPLICIGPPERQLVHATGGRSAIVDDGEGHRRFEESHPHMNAAVDPTRDQLVRARCEMIELHCVLVRSDVLRQVTPLDEGLRSLMEHTDLGLALRELGGETWFEPAVKISYLPPTKLRGDGRRYYVARWSDEWNEVSVGRFREKWQLPADDACTRDTLEFAAWLRARAYLPYRSPFIRIADRRSRYPRSLIDRIAQHDALRWYRRGVAASGPPRLVHRPSWMEETTRA